MTATAVRWRDHAACAGIPAEDLRLADCGPCPVQNECLRDALEDEADLDPRTGYWYLIRGGRLAGQRKKVMAAVSSDVDQAYVRLIADREARAARLRDRYR